MLMMYYCTTLMMELRMPKKNYPLNHKDYTLYEEVGQGVSAIVYRALCIPLDQIVAIKVIDLEKCDNDMDMIRREVQTMILLDHPNLLKAHCSFMATRSLWIVMPYMAAGSCLHIIKSAYPDGFEEHTIVTLLYGVLKALAYLHSHGHIHRDVKAGNILVSSKGGVKLADFGVSTSLFESGNRLHSRKTFVGTPCWMAPEVMQQLHGYDFKADIWSFGITALELAHGHAPFSKYPPMKVLLMTLQNAPPGLDYERDKRFSKDQKKRPTAEKLLKHRFFKNARSREFIVRTILDGLRPLGDRFRMLKQKEAEMFGQNGEEHLSQQEYIRGISAWKFDIEDLKRQALLIQDDDGITLAANQGWICKDKNRTDISAGQLKRSIQDIPNGVTRPHVEESVDSINGPAACVIPALHRILLQNVMQMVQITRSIENFHQITGNRKADAVSSASAREKVLEAHVNFIETRIKRLDEELQIQKTKNAKLERPPSQIDKEASLSHRRN